MTNPAQTLVRMIGFLIIVGIIAGFLYAPLVDAFLANPALNGMILAALLIGILFALRQVVRLRPEVAWIESFRRQQPGLSMIDAPRLLAPIAAMIGERRDERMSLSTLSLRSLLDSLATRLDESRDLSRYLIGLLI
ncbi:MAG: flagellar motor protein MotA, partial [Pseudomonadota bacterium]|nr:flagellar motor protein MotA [Pseudomonadota bacterium]